MTYTFETEVRLLIKSGDLRGGRYTRREVERYIDSNMLSDAEREVMQAALRDWPKQGESE